ncbi:hypothetical protein [Phytoactinopolyspora halotolerans]|uniref:Uncharacterized protein n=1 Tax=Phytoactinopolyspora halotolerans TaxID=1981512 RepID=A0A6L9S1D1_9ACTN|nr:hypothetical protein [Phytoactinopolyspora halotolerans]NED98995.1 hypothetical protein [Phytoactinopolyspora halotolerans]
MSTDRTIAVVLDAAGTASASADGSVAWWRYATEVLDHVRLPYRRLDLVDETATGDYVGLLVLTRTPALDDAAIDRLAAWVRAGGALLTVGEPGALAEVAGVSTAGSVDDGHVRVAHDDDAWTQAPDVPVHAIGGVRLQPADTTVRVLATWDDGDTAAITARRVGAGVVVCCAADVWQSIVRIQQGYPVHHDGQPAADGSAPIDDGILKCEDGLALDFTADRALPPGEPAMQTYEHTIPPASGLPMFHRPHADLWRSVFLQILWWTADQVDVVTPWLHYWPAGVPAVGHMSHDADQNVEEHGRTALEVFDEADVSVTWCQLYPGGYRPETYAAVSAAGHEQALHYNAMHDADIATWGWPQFRAQYAWAQAVTGTERIVSNKNHYTRWEGWTEFYDWCERVGIEIDQSRGPSKQGTIGFPFGTTHVSFPIAGADQGYRYYDVLNLPLHTQDLALAGHESIRDVIIDAALAQHGVAHFLFHGPHLHRRPATRKACLALADEVRRRGMQWWTSGRINAWERRRRGVRLAVQRADDGWRVKTIADEGLPGAGILLPFPERADRNPYRLQDGDGTVTPVRRHGREFLELTVDIPAGTASWTVA